MNKIEYKTKRFQIIFLAMTFLAVSLLHGCAPGRKNGHKTLFLHGLGLKNFVQRGPTEIYNRDNIFDYINGEAEAYLPLGFRLLYIGHYRKPGTDKMMLVDAYDMGAPNGAREVFDLYSRKGGMKVEGLGSAGWTDNSIILFCRDRYFFRVWPDSNAETEGIAELKDLLELSRSIDGRLREAYSQ
jgi:hypothetical protein